MSKFEVSMKHRKDDDKFVVSLQKKSTIVGEYVIDNADSALDLYNEILDRLNGNNRAKSNRKER